MTLALIAGFRWADRSNLSRSDRNRVVMLMHLLERTAGPAPALLLGQHEVRRLAPPPAPAVAPVRDAVRQGGSVKGPASPEPAREARKA